MLSRRIAATSSVVSCLKPLGMRSLPEAVHDAHAGLGILPLLEDRALAGDAAGAAFRAASVVEAARTVVTFLVESRRTYTHELAKLLGG